MEAIAHAQDNIDLPLSRKDPLWYLNRGKRVMTTLVTWLKYVGGW